jgi:hypothetical protein
VNRSVPWEVEPVEVQVEAAAALLEAALAVRVAEEGGQVVGAALLEAAGQDLAEGEAGHLEEGLAGLAEEQAERAAPEELVGLAEQVARAEERAVQATATTTTLTRMR